MSYNIASFMFSLGQLRVKAGDARSYGFLKCHYFSKIIYIFYSEKISLLSQLFYTSKCVSGIREECPTVTNHKNVCSVSI